MEEPQPVQQLAPDSWPYHIEPGLHGAGQVAATLAHHAIPDRVRSLAIKGSNLGLLFG